MQERTKPPTFDPREWAQFDFTRWHVDGLPVDAVPAAVADLAQGLFGSDEWRQRVQASLPTIQRGVLDAYRDHARQLEGEKTTVAKDFDERINAARSRSEEFGTAIETASSPPVVVPDPETYHLGVRVTSAKNTHLGLAGVIAKVTAPGDRDTVLAHAVTDQDGNALVAIPATHVGDTSKGDATLEILTPEGKTLQRLEDAVCIRPNQVDTKRISIKDSPGTAPLRSAALEFRTQREARARELVGRTDQLAQERHARLRDLDDRLEQVRTIISELDEGQSWSSKTPTPATPPRAEAETAEPSPPRTRSRKS